MVSTKHTVSVRLASDAERRLRRAAALQKQSQGAFLEKAGDDRARAILREWAAARYREGNRSFSELAEDTGLAVEEIMTSIAGSDWQAGLEMFLTSCKSIATMEKRPEFFHLAEEAVKTVNATQVPARTDN
ncbi:MAG TPA: hypothetical protein VKT80_13650 [Chloroflexota bacterium]|nr:hypothetical protein [Chloroflexota bacterium]